MLKKIVGFHQDEAHDWVADLSCGHSRHVRHQPPFTNRPWATTAEGRASFLGFELDCHRCDEETPVSNPPGRPAAG
jgi:tellurite methyltransferase